MSLKNNTVGGFLSIVSLLSFVLVIFLLLVRDIPTANVDIIKICLIALINLVTGAFGFYLGSSFGSQQKTNQIQEALDTKQD